MSLDLRRSALKRTGITFLLVAMLCVLPHALAGQTPARQTPACPEVPDWALPGSATHKQVPPPADFHRPSLNFETPIGISQGQSDIGGALFSGQRILRPRHQAVHDQLRRLQHLVPAR